MDKLRFGGCEHYMSKGASLGKIKQDILQELIYGQFLQFELKHDHMAFMSFKK